MTKLRLSYVTGRTYTHRGLEENARSLIGPLGDCCWAPRKEGGGRMAPEPWKLCRVAN